ncbi:MAG: hypothetical protein ABI723_15485 [Bacteroidia bacterium]
MTEADRNKRNTTKLAELYPTFKARLMRVIQKLEASGLRPRIQDAWRSPQDQLNAFNTGHSKLKFGFHNVTGADGVSKESLAVDMLDDDHPLNSALPYLLQLAAAAEANGLATGIRWGLPVDMRTAIDNAIAAKNWTAPVKIGWDPTHVEPAGMTAAQAKTGARPA